MKNLPYLLPCFIPITMVAGFLRGESWPFRIVLLMFAVVTILDLLISYDGRNPAPQPGDAISRHLFSHLALWMWLPAQAAIVTFGLLTVTGKPLHWFGILTTIICVGMTGGMLSTPAAHELMHRPSRFERMLAEMQMSLLSYTHFCIEHAQGHHARVATPEDPATARIGESLYAFYPRAVLGGFASAWRIEAERLRRRNLSVASSHNRMVRGLLLVAAIYAGTAYFFGFMGILFFAAQSLVGFSIVEAFNYVQHYGLSRNKRTDGTYEKASHMHSWNSNHPVSNWLILNLGRHSDHHCHAGKDYSALRGLEHAPQLPTGLYGMWVLALFPPLWFDVMNPLAALYRVDSTSGLNAEPVEQAAVANERLE
jgi:alkane 1-monooxygenase